MADDTALAPPAPPGGSSPHRFTWDEVVRLAAANVFGETTRVELIAGELFTMPEEGFAPVDAVRVLQTYLLTHVAPAGLCIAVREPVHLADGSALIPDLSVFPGGTGARAMQAARALLIVEVSDSSLAYDRDTKAALYAKDGVQELWIVEVRARAVSVHRAPANGVWSSVSRSMSGQAIEPACAPYDSVCFVAPLAPILAWGGVRAIIASAQDRTYETLLLEMHGRVALMRLNRPQALNALNDPAALPEPSDE
jgi:hypothetical protein